MAGCLAASQRIRQFLGWQVVWGDYDPTPEDEHPPRLYGHVWNLMPDGRIFDATAAQFGLTQPHITTTDNPHYVAAPQEWQVL